MKPAFELPDDWFVENDGQRLVLDPEKVKAAFEARVALQGWQPIETAPRDGKPFLAWENEDRGPFKCWWHENWLSDEAYWDDHACTEPQPTHWQPLPQPPAASDREERR
jgi:hypothetical protein